MEGLHSDSSEYWIGSQRAKKEFPLTGRQSGKRLRAEVIRNTQRRPFCGVDVGTVRASGKFGSDNENNSTGLFHRYALGALLGNQVSM